LNRVNPRSGSMLERSGMRSTLSGKGSPEEPKPGASAAPSKSTLRERIKAAINSKDREAYYIIGYGIRRGHDGSRLQRAIEKFPNKRLLNSQYIIKIAYDTNAEWLLEYFRQYVRENDRLSVARIADEDYYAVNLYAGLRSTRNPKLIL
jgi:hypothetical protein